MNGFLKLFLAFFFAIIGIFVLLVPHHMKFDNKTFTLLQYYNIGPQQLQTYLTDSNLYSDNVIKTVYKNNPDEFKLALDRYKNYKTSKYVIYYKKPYISKDKISTAVCYIYDKQKDYTCVYEKYELRKKDTINITYTATYKPDMIDENKFDNTYRRLFYLEIKPLIIPIYFNLPNLMKIFES